MKKQWINLLIATVLAVGLFSTWANANNTNPPNEPTCVVDNDEPGTEL